MPTLKPNGRVLRQKQIPNTMRNHIDMLNEFMKPHHKRNRKTQYIYSDQSDLGVITELGRANRKQTMHDEKTKQIQRKLLLKQEDEQSRAETSSIIFVVNDHGYHRCRYHRCRRSCPHRAAHAAFWMTSQPLLLLPHLAVVA